MSALRWKRRIGKMAGRLPRSESRRVLLLYHSIGDSPLAVREAEFQGQVRWLEQVHTCSLDALLSDDQLPGLRVAITFDDGYVSLAGTAEGILSAAGMTATAYLNAGMIEDHTHRSSETDAGHYPDETFLSWADVRHLRAKGWTIGSHGVEHVDLTTLPCERVAAELTVSKAIIEDRTGVPCDHFSYTWGRNNAVLRSDVRNAGYRYAAAAVHGPVRSGYDPFAIPRINIHRDYSIADFAAIVQGDWDFLGVWQRTRLRWA